MASQAILKTDLPFPVRRGKVRDVYDLGDKLLLVSTDRISAFDWVLPTPIPDKGRILNQLSAFWLGKLTGANHMLSTRFEDFGLAESYRPQLAGRAMLARKAKVVPFECVARGYLMGSGWKEYRESSAVCGIPLPKGLVEASKLPEPIFTPATKAETGHDINVSFETMRESLGGDLADDLRRRTLALYQQGADYAATKGILVADTKFEFGLAGEELLLIDEALTPDSSRFWPADQYSPGRSPPSFDKQFVRDWLEQSGWDKQSPPPPLPEDVIERTRARYLEAFEGLTGKTLA